jgi:hypothetical protein
MDGNALAQQTPGPGAGAPTARHAQRLEQPIQGAGAGAQEGVAQVGVQTTGIGFIGRQPFGQQNPQPQPAGLPGGQPDRLEGNKVSASQVLGRPGSKPGGRGGAGRARKARTAALRGGSPSS